MSSRKVRWVAGAGVLWLATFACVFAFVPTRSSSSVSSTSTSIGEVVVVEESSTTSTWQDDPADALRLLGGVVGTAAVAFGLVCWGGSVGRILVLATVGPMSLLILLSQALFFAPGMQLLCAAAVLGEAERRERRRRLPPPPGYRAADAVAHLDS